jgi:hypothetical protein
VKNKLKYFVDLGAAIYAGSDLMGVINAVALSEPVVVGSKEYWMLYWIDIGEFARWHSMVIYDLKYDDEESSILFTDELKQPWHITLLQGAPLHILQMYVTWQKDFKYLTEYRRQNVERYLREDYDFLLRRIPDK